MCAFYNQPSQIKFCSVSTEWVYTHAKHIVHIYGYMYAKGLNYVQIYVVTQLFGQQCIYIYVYIHAVTYCVFCFSEESSLVTNYHLIVGSHHKNITESNEKTVAVERIIIHPQWDTFALYNDIALLKLTEPLVYNEHVLPVCLTQRDFPPGRMCTVAGWGQTLSECLHLKL